jgi:hypothetical protein
VGRARNPGGLARIPRIGRFLVLSNCDISQHPFGNIGVDRIGGDQQVIVIGGGDFDPLLGSGGRE